MSTATATYKIVISIMQFGFTYVPLSFFTPSTEKSGKDDELLYREHLRDSVVDDSLESFFTCDFIDPNVCYGLSSGYSYWACVIINV